MRGALKNPASNLSSKIQRLNPGFNPMREIRAKTTQKHNRVNRFGSPIPKPASAKPANQVVHAEVTPRHKDQAAPVASAAAGSAAVALPSMVTSASHHRLERLLDVALTRADAHKKAMRYEAAKHFWQKPDFLGRRAGLKLAVCAILLMSLIGFVAWRNVPQLSVMVASAKAHIEASVPGYVPSGFSQASPASTDDNAVIIKYKAIGTNNRGYDISQKQSNMTSVSLAQAVVPQGSSVQTSQVGGNTVYIYGKQNNAAWVNNGVLHKITDRAQLSSDEIIKIVQGLNN
jgi:hypothetical protein